MSVSDDSNKIIETHTSDSKYVEHVDIEFIDENFPFHFNSTLIEPLNPLDV